MLETKINNYNYNTKNVTIIGQTLIPMVRIIHVQPVSCLNLGLDPPPPNPLPLKNSNFLNSHSKITKKNQA